jgi:gamma-glutamylcyclotransferase (GGCT)/AIG2-like uncharacterized protein YtfP
MANLFVYGTLCFPEIVEKLTGKSFQTENAVLKGYERKRIRNTDYPAIIKNENSEVEGLLLWNVDKRSLKIFSFYEGDEYASFELTVIVNSKHTKAKVFVWISNINDLENLDWDLDEFAKKSLNTYIKKIVPDTVWEFNQE